MTEPVDGVGGSWPRSVVIDPRIRTRRIAVRRDQGRRRLKRLTAVLGVVAALVAAGALTQTPLLDVDRVRVEGATRTAAEEVARVAGIERGEPMLSVDAGGAVARVEDLPWVDRARVTRRWPGTVEVSVTEREPTAVVEVTEGRMALVDEEGRVLDVTPIRPPPTAAHGAGPGTGTVAPDVPPELPRVTGVEGRIAEGEQLSRAARDALVVLHALSERLPGVVTAVRTDLDAELAGGGLVRFGSIDDLDDKVVAVETVLADVDLSGLEVLDVRVPGSPALTRH